jgi:hypothetical protein
MRRLLSLAFLSTSLACALPLASAKAAEPGVAPMCRVRVVHSEETPFAWMGEWRVNVTLRVAPPSGAPFETTVSRTIPWQQSPPRFGDTFWLHCDPASGAVFY